MLFSFSACNHGSDNPVNDDNKDTKPVVTKPSVLTAVAQSAPVNQCPNGGIEVKAGIDENLNGILDDPGEVDLVQYVCNGIDGTNGLNALVAVSDEAAGSHCSAGGQKISSGADSNANGILDADEISSADYLCNGINGSNGVDGNDGADGSNGANSLLSISDEPVGANCANGGLKVVSWLDSVANGVLDAQETASTNYVCKEPGTIAVQSITANPVTVRPGQSSTLSVSANDSGGATLTYQWSGADGSFSSSNSATTDWTAPLTAGNYQVQVTVGNGSLSVDAYAFIQVTTAPDSAIITNITPAQVHAGDELVISGGGFGDSQSSSYLELGALTVTSVLSWSDTQIHLIVPDGTVSSTVIVNVAGVPSTPGYVFVPWNSGDNVAISQASGNQELPALVADGHGGAIIVWQDDRNGDSDIYAQRVGAAGSPLWQTDGVVVSDTAENQFAPRIIADGNGGAIVVWLDLNGDVVGQRITSVGSRLWLDSGVVVGSSHSTDHYRVVSDGQAGIFVVWIDVNGFRVQHTASNGKDSWLNDESIASGAKDDDALDVIADGAGGMFVAWIGNDGSDDYVKVQHLDSSGKELWRTTGIVVTNPLQAAPLDSPQLLADGRGGIYVGWSTDTQYNYGAVQFEHISALGQIGWIDSNDPAPVGVLDMVGTNRNMQLPQTVSDGAGGVMVVWQSYITRGEASNQTEDPDIKAQLIDIDGVQQWNPYDISGIGDYDSNAYVTHSSGNSKAGHVIKEHQAVADGRGGAIVVWNDFRNSSTSPSIYAQRINRGGARDWIDSLNGVVVSENTINPSNLRVVSDGNGGAIIVWQDFRNGSDYDIYAQRISADGVR